MDMRIGSKRFDSLKYFIGMMLPTLILYSLYLYIIGKTVSLSFFNWDGFSEKTFAGFENFIRLFMDERFVISLRNIGILIAATVIFQVGLGIVLAFLLTDMRIGFEKFFKSVIFMPVVISNVAVSLYFLTMYDYQNGFINYLLTTLGLEKVNFLGSGLNTIYYAIIPQTWQYIGMMFIVAYTAFTTVDKDFIDASKIDGLNMFQRLVHMYVPISWDSVSVCFIIAMVGPLKAFEHIWILTTGGGSDQMTHIPGTLMFYIGFSNYEYGYGSSVAVVIFALAMFLVLGFRKLTAKNSYN